MIIVLAFWIAVIVGIAVVLVRYYNQSPAQSSQLPNNEAQIRYKIAHELRAQKDQYDSEDKKKVVEEMAYTVEYFADHPYAPQTTYASPKSDNTDSPKVAKPLDSSIALLYLGTFLVICAIALYVGFGAGDTIKGFVVSTLALLLFGGGLYVHGTYGKLKPVGTTFTILGLLTVPFAGLSFYTYSFNRGYGAPVAFVTSLVCVYLSYVILKVLQDWYVPYFLTVSIIATVLSLGNVFGGNTVYYAVSLAFSGLLLGLLALVQPVPQRRTAFLNSSLISATVAIPFALSLYASLRAAGLACLMSALCYGLVGLTTKNTKDRPAYAAIAQFVGILSISLFADSLDFSNSTGLVLCALSVFYAALWAYFYTLKVGQEYRVTTQVFALVLPIVALIVGFNSTSAMLLVGPFFMYITLLSIVMYFRESQVILAFVALASLIPAIIGVGSQNLNSVNGAYYALSFGVIALISLFISYIYGKKFPAVRFLARTLFYGMSVASFIASLMLDVPTLALVSFAIGILYLADTYIHNYPTTAIFAQLLGHYSILRLLVEAGVSTDRIALLQASLAGFVYVLLYLSRFNTLRAQYIRLLSLVVVGLCSVLGLSYPSVVVYPLLLGLLAVLLSIEVRNKSRSEREVAIGIGVVALLWLMYVAGSREVLLYSHIFAAMWFAFAYARYYIGDKTVANQYVWLGLIVLSVSTVGASLNSVESWYSYFTLIEHIIIALIAAGFKAIRFVWWGIGVTTLSLVYALREFRYAAVAVLGVLVISIAAYFLSKNAEPKE